MSIVEESGSFRDPSGGVFYYNEKICRWLIDESNIYTNFLNSQLFNNLVKEKQFISTKSIDFNKNEPVIQKYGTVCQFFEHDPIWFISYPYEWAPSMLFDAARLTLNLQIRLLEQGLSLKDATPYNIQFENTNPIFIDFGSVKNASTNAIWIAYNQFCQMFLYPLLMIQFQCTNGWSIYLSHLDGLTFGETVKSLGYRPFWRYFSVLDYLIPAIIEKTKWLKKLFTHNTVSVNRSFENSALIQIGTVKRLQRFLNKLSYKKKTSNWTDYKNICLYDDQDYKRKMSFVSNCLTSNPIKSVLDIGCNTGDFSILASENNCKVVALDLDINCIERLYHLSKEGNYSILPLCLDLSQPSPAIGWFNSERKSFLNRSKNYFDCVFGLAVIHHLLVTGRVSFEQICNLFHFLSSRFIIIEYVDPSDKMFQELIKYRAESYQDFNRTVFEQIMMRKFKIHKKEEFINPQQSLNRYLYFMEKQ